MCSHVHMYSSKSHDNMKNGGSIQRKHEDENIYTFSAEAGKKLKQDLHGALKP